MHQAPARHPCCRPLWSWHEQLALRAPSHEQIASQSRTEAAAAPCALATLLISSMISTVLPTPAPPNRPILPPRWYGASRSTTLMPVTRISWSVDCSTKGGASRWMDHRSEYSAFREVMQNASGNVLKWQERSARLAKIRLVQANTKQHTHVMTRNMQLLCPSTGEALV
eukprot:353561-Chlamydomonas_euryale.AAC.5